MISAQFVPKDLWNLVPALESINAVVGNAPLRVKFALRDFYRQKLQEVIIFPKLSNTARNEMLEQIGRNFINQYRVQGILPWRWSAHTFKKSISKKNQEKIRKEIRHAYMKLLTEEEIKLGAYFK